MFYVGLDIHTTHITGCVLNDQGKVHERWTVRTLEELMRRLRRLPRFEVTYEASTGYGRFFAVLITLARRVVVAHPGLLKIIFRSKQKNDRADAQKLAQLLYVDQVPAVHVPSEDVRAWRELITFRRRLIEKRTRAKNGIRGLLRSLGICAPKRPGLWSKQGLAWLRELAFENRMHALKRSVLLSEIETLSHEIRLVEQELGRFAADSAAVQILRTIPGVGLRTAEAVAAFIDNPHRFARSKQIGSYFGLVPSQDQSGRTNRLGHITREGPRGALFQRGSSLLAGVRSLQEPFTTIRPGRATVRHLLTEAVWQAVRRSPTVRAYFERVRRDDPGRRKIAIVATAHYLARVMWAMLKDGSVWQERVTAA